MGVIQQVSAASSNTAPAAATGARVLIVDDDERNAFAAVQALEDLGHELVVAQSGKEALRQLLDGDFAVILLDLHMPEMDGYETARFIRGHPRTKHIPIVFVTAVFRDEAHLFQAYTVGAVDVVFKPVDPFILRSKVSVLVDLHLKTVEVSRQAERLKGLIEENAKVHAEKLEAERALRRTQERQEAILRSLPIVIHARAAEPPFAPLFVSEQAEAVCGFPASRFVDEPGFGFGRVHPEDADRVMTALRAALDTGAYACEYRWQGVDGSYRCLLDRGIAARSDDGEVLLFGSLQDVTEHKALEEQLAQAQKMEAVGQLTGGVAHDFNNLLTIVMGNADMMIRRCEPDSPMLLKLQAIRQAAERGQALNRQLLAFARRDRLRSEVTNVDTLIADFLPLIAQAVGEAVTVTAEPAGEELRVEVDPAHLETALLNLAVNARDAMSEGGELTIRTARVSGRGLGATRSKADFAVIEVQDTGCGMSEDVVKHVFEPFFTTKEVGKGSGLGLAQVYGFMQQSGGEVRVQSRKGQGATFQLYLPLTDRSAPPAATKASADKALVGGSEEILVVEDDDQVRALTVEMLQGLGYAVVVAPNAKAALTLLKSKTTFGALMTDVVMPGGMSGIQLAKSARKLRPGLPILLTSGFAGGQGVADDGFAFLSKPYELGVLASRLRDLIGQTQAVS
jgi:signal transduction histidine kinase/DNA-binding response OmpR family regulator